MQRCQKAEITGTSPGRGCCGKVRGQVFEPGVRPTRPMIAITAPAMAVSCAAIAKV